MKVIHDLINNPLDNCKIECENKPKNGYKILISDPLLENTIGPNLEISLSPLKIVNNKKIKVNH